MDVGSVYGSYYETAKSYMGLRKEEKQAGFAEKVTDKSQVSSEDMTLEEYKDLVETDLLELHDIFRDLVREAIQELEHPYPRVFLRHG